MRRERDRTTSSSRCARTAGMISAAPPAVGRWRPSCGGTIPRPSGSAPISAGTGSRRPCCCCRTGSTTAGLTPSIRGAWSASTGQAASSCPDCAAAARSASSSRRPRTRPAGRLAICASMPTSRSGQAASGSCHGRSCSPTRSARYGSSSRKRTASPCTATARRPWRSPALSSSLRASAGRAERPAAQRRKIPNENGPAMIDARSTSTPVCLTAVAPASSGRSCGRTRARSEGLMTTRNRPPRR
jgi:hypothetical protein